MNTKDLNIEMKDKNPKCPLCGKPQFTSYKIRCQSNDVVVWFHCQCGTIFHNHESDFKFDNNYKEKWINIKGMKERSEYVMRVYSPLVEDLTYGRKFLDVGFVEPYAIKFMEKRGWISTGIDIIDNDYITEDYNKFEFNDKFDFIHLGHVLESVDSIQDSFKKTKELLARDGCVLITLPCPEILFSTGIRDFGHFPKWKEKWILPSRSEIEKLAIKNDLKLVLYRKNFEQRYPSWNDAHYLFTNE
jgi:hypothetical protein